ncbi:MAG: acyltransferase family protein, partial [Kaistella sp.]
FTYFGIAFILLYLMLNPFGYRSADLIRAVQVTILSVMGIAPLLWGLIHERTFVSRFLSTDAMVLLGKSSYVFYLIHKGFIPILIYDYIAENVAVIFIIITALSVLMFKYIEEPLNHFIRKRYAK